MRDEPVISRIAHRRMRKQSTTRVPAFLSISYLIGSPPIGTSMITLTSWAASSPRRDGVDIHRYDLSVSAVRRRLSGSVKLAGFLDHRLHAVEGATAVAWDDTVPKCSSRRCDARNIANQAMSSLVPIRFSGSLRPLCLSYSATRAGASLPYRRSVSVRCIHADAIRSPFERQDPCNLINPSLCGADMRSVSHRHEGLRRADIDDRSTRLSKIRERSAHHMERSDQIDVDHDAETVRRQGIGRG